MTIDTQTLKQHVSEAAFENISKWLNEPKYAEYVNEIEQLVANQNWQELEDSFFKVLEFGTAGRRGMVGLGSNRINRVTIGESTQALCLYSSEFDEQARQKGVVIACDTRLSSPELSRITAEVCAANGFKTYIFDSFRSTPELSFAVRHLGAAVGIVVSASHNPPADNGFKAYWSDGAQLVAPHDKGVLAKADEIQEIHSVDFDEAVQAGDIILIGDDVDRAYVDAAVNEAVGEYRDIAIVYSPLHGAGQTNVLPVLERAGFKDVRVVEEQMTPDGNFPTIPNGKPNPQEIIANEMAVEKLLAEKADIAITNDPDADRIGVVALHEGKPVYLNGNQSAALAADYVLGRLRQSGKLTPKHFLAKTIVTTDLLQALTDYYGVKLYGNMLVGMKYIGELIRNKETTDEIFLLGGEESYGMIKGTYVRDKDGAAGALTLAEAAAELKAANKTLYTRLLELFVEHGIYEETLVDVQFPGADGFETMQTIMKQLTSSTPSTLGGYRVSAVQDYTTLERRDVETGDVTPVDCISGNVIVFELGDPRRRVTVRPSGTEPKLKLYVQWYEETTASNVDEALEAYDELKSRLDEFTVALKNQVLEG
ncbi:phospho-sugar mutase [Candidatus Saccharibacteria bacterium]|nr:phospho-sugar mutase [Candidatus Saccharibacteria bacterium]MBH2007182.1 phospho-sugar mutase [Candidatus Saccharibacteria bacterium]